MDERSRTTREHLLTAATRVFAEHGFRDSTIRQISELAAANVASVNYHFGDKEALYREVLQGSFQFVGARVSDKPESLAVSTPTARLRAFVESALRQLLSDAADAEGPHSGVIAREVMDPTPALESLVRSFIEPQMRVLEGIIRELLGEGTEEAGVRLCVASVVGQIIFHHRFRVVEERLFPERSAGPTRIELLADHVTRFSVAALRGFRDPTLLESRDGARGESEPTETAVHLL